MTTKISTRLLEALSPLDELSAASRQVLLQTAKGARLTADKSIRDWQFKEELLYLLDGTLRDEESGYVYPPALEQNRTEPLFSEHSYDVTLYAESDCQLLRFNRLEYQALQEQQVRDQNQPQIDVNVQESSLVHEVFIACSMGAMELPQMPRVAMRVRALCANDNTSAAELTIVLQTDAVLAGRLVHAASSVLYRGQTPIEHVKEAVIRMGFKTVNQMALSLAMKKEYKAQSRMIQRCLEKFWHESAQVSAIVYVMAEKMEGMDQDRALFIGLLHNIGVLPVLLYLDKMDRSVEQQEVDQVIKKVAPVTGQMVVDSWELGESVELAVSESMDWNRSHEGGPDYCDLVIAARWLSLSIDGDQENLPEMAEIPALEKLGIADPGVFLDEAREQIIELQVILSG